MYRLNTWTTKCTVLLPLFAVLLTDASSIFRDPFLEHSGSSLEPEFLEPIKNVTVHAGREAILSCVVANLGKKNLGWLKHDDQTLLTLGSKVITQNTRITVVPDNDKQTWSLHIAKVRETDRGCYMCQINTNIMKKQFGCLDVHVSPQIIDNETSSDITVREGDNATLFCRARGHPAPRIVWKREDGEKIAIRSKSRSDSYRGYDNITTESLQFFRLDRRQMGTFLCIASNDVPPAVSKRITLDVNFQPMIKVPGQLLGAPFGSDVVLECMVEACPKAFIYWRKNHEEMLLEGLGLKNSTKYQIEETKITYKIFIKLTILGFSKQDVGIYKCVATNSMGKAEAEIRLHEIKVPKSTSATENQVITSTGYATPPVSTATKPTGHWKNRNQFEKVGLEGSKTGGHEQNTAVRRPPKETIIPSSAASSMHQVWKTNSSVILGLLAVIFINYSNVILFLFFSMAPNLSSKELTSGKMGNPLKKTLLVKQCSR